MLSFRALSSSGTKTLTKKTPIRAVSTYTESKGFVMDYKTLVVGIITVLVVVASVVLSVVL